MRASVVLLPLLGAVLCAQPVELGDVRWNRDLDKALEVSGRSGKPVLLFFQEVPGCQGCRDFGSEVLRHPLVAEAIEDLFVPVAIRNNTEGDDDAEVRRKFREPAWNFPVTRFLDPAGRDLIPRKERARSIHGQTTRMILALEEARQPVPAYLRNLGREQSPLLREAVFDTHCFHIGELRIPPLPGVIATEAGWTTGGEAVKVRFDPSLTSLAKISGEGDRLSCISRFYVDDPKGARGMKQPVATLASAKYQVAARSDRHWNLRRHPHQFLPLTPMQRTKINALLAYGNKRAEQFLSPRQKRLLPRVEALWNSKDKHRLESLSPPEDGKGLARYQRELDSLLPD
jgi:hypothetical protein